MIAYLVCWLVIILAIFPEMELGDPEEDLIDIERD
jgi:hypothetical protein